MLTFREFWNKLDEMAFDMSQVTQRMQQLMQTPQKISPNNYPNLFREIAKHLRQRQCHTRRNLQQPCEHPGCEKLEKYATWADQFSQGFPLDKRATTIYQYLKNKPCSYNCNHKICSEDRKYANLLFQAINK